VTVEFPDLDPAQGSTKTIDARWLTQD